MRFFVLILFAMSLFAVEYDSLLMRAQASVFPKIMLLDKDIDNKMISGAVVLSIVYSSDELLLAKDFKEFINKEFKGKLGEHKFEIELVHIDEVTKSTNSSAYFLFSTSHSTKQEVISRSIEQQRICFSYNYKDFNNKVLISLFVKEKTYIYLNKSVLHDYGVNFIPIFYKIAKVKES